MVDELRLKLGPTIIRTMVAKILNKAIRKRFGVDVDILIREVTVTSTDKVINFDISLNAEMPKEDFMKLIKENITD